MNKDELRSARYECDIVLTEKFKVLVGNIDFGVRTKDYEIRKFDLLDYMDYTPLTFHNFLVITLCNSDINSIEKKVFSNFMFELGIPPYGIKKYNNGEKFEDSIEFIEDMMILESKLGYKLDNGVLIESNKSRVLEDNEKSSMLDSLEINNYPINYFTYTCLLERMKNGNYINSKVNKYPDLTRYEELIILEKDEYKSAKSKVINDNFTDGNVQNGNPKVLKK
jgi:hypothetical protein